MPSQSEENEVEVPWGKGILGWVAETGETVNLDVAYEVSPILYCACAYQLFWKHLAYTYLYSFLVVKKSGFLIMMYRAQK